MKWAKFLKEKQAPCIVPPHYSKLTVEQRKLNYPISFDKPLKTWSLVSLQGKVLREAYPWETLRTLRGYPKVKVALYKQKEDYWLYTSEKGIGRVKVIEPYKDLQLPPLTVLALRMMGTVPVVEEVDVRSNPKLPYTAVSLLKQERLDDVSPPKTLNKAQKLAFNLLLQEEKLRRIPPTEQRIRDAIKSFKGDLFSIQEIKDGYIIRFNYRGRNRIVTVNEDLRVTDINMCMEGSHRKYDLEGLLAALIYEDTGQFGYPVYY